jgi:hypothetical protein
VPLKVCDETINVLKSAMRKAKLGREEELSAIRRLDDQARKVEATTSGQSFDAMVSGEFDKSYLYGARSVFG